MIVTNCVRFPANISVASRCKMAFGGISTMYGMNLCMLNWFLIVKLNANNFVVFLFMSM